MKEQFEDSVGKVSDHLDDWENNVFVDDRQADGTRLITVWLPGRTAEKPPINLILHSSKSRIAIWVFYERYQP